MDERDQVYCKHILDSLKAIQGFLHGKTLEEFSANRLLHDGVIRELEIIGEAANHCSPAFQAAHPTIPWGDMVGMRNKLIHDYMGVDMEVVWRTVHEHLPGLQKELEST